MLLPHHELKKYQALVARADYDRYRTYRDRDLTPKTLNLHVAYFEMFRPPCLVPHLFRGWGTPSRARGSALSSRHIAWVALPEYAVYFVPLVVMAVVVSVYDCIRFSLPEERAPSAIPAFRADQ